MGDVCETDVSRGGNNRAQFNTEEDVSMLETLFKLKESPGAN